MSKFALISNSIFFFVENLKNLIDYIYRMKGEFWPDWESCTLEGSSYKSDHGHLYFKEKVKNFAQENNGPNGAS